MSSNGRKKRAKQEISSEDPAVDVDMSTPPPPRPPNLRHQPAVIVAPAAPPSLLKDVLWKIVQYSPNHLRLRLISNDWNQAVVDAHCDRSFSCQSCCCTSSLGQFPLKRLLLPWVTKWNFTIGSTTQVLLTEMMYRQEYPGGPQVPRIPNPNRPIPPIAQCSVEIGDANYRDALPVFSSTQMQHLKELEIRGISRPTFSAAGRKHFVAALTKLDELESLDISDFNFDYDGSVGQRDFHRLVKSPHLKTCITSSCGLTDEALSIFASSPSISKLETLEFITNATISAVGVRDCIATSPFLTNLTCLNFHESKIGDAAIVAVCTSTSLTRLSTFWIPGCNLTDASINAMVASANMKGVQRLSIECNRISASGLTSLLLSASKQNAAFSQLRQLHANRLSTLHGPQFSHEVAVQFSPVIDRPRLIVRNALTPFQIGDEINFNELAVGSLAKIPLMFCVFELDITCSTEIAPSLLFTSSSQFTNLKILKIAAPKISWQVLKDLANSLLSNEIQMLSLSPTGAAGTPHQEQHLDDGCCKALADSTCLGQLKTLNLSKPRLSVSIGLILLLSSQKLPSLTHLNCALDSPASYVVAESMTEVEASERIVQLLTTTASRIQVLKFPNTAFAASVRALVQERVQSVRIE